MDRFEDFIAKAAEIAAEADHVRARGESAFGRVRVEVAADGRIMELRIADELRAQDTGVLARLIREAHDAALDRAEAKVHELRTDFTNDPYVAKVTRELAAVEEQRPPVSNSGGAAAEPPPGRGMTDAEMDAYYERLNRDPLGRNRY